MYNVDVNILFANVEILQGSQLGGTVAIISGERADVTRAIEYFIEKNVGVEVLKDGRISRISSVSLTMTLRLTASITL